MGARTHILHAHLSNSLNVLENRSGWEAGAPPLPTLTLNALVILVRGTSCLMQKNFWDSSDPPPSARPVFPIIPGVPIRGENFLSAVG